MLFLIVLKKLPLQHLKTKATYTQLRINEFSFPAEHYIVTKTKNIVHYMNFQIKKAYTGSQKEGMLQVCQTLLLTKLIHAEFSNRGIRYSIRRRNAIANVTYTSGSLIGRYLEIMRYLRYLSACRTGRLYFRE